MATKMAAQRSLNGGLGERVQAVRLCIPSFARVMGLNSIHLFYDTGLDRIGMAFLIGILSKSSRTLRFRPRQR